MIKDITHKREDKSFNTVEEINNYLRRLSFEHKGIVEILYYNETQVHNKYVVSIAFKVTKITNNDW